MQQHYTWPSYIDIYDYKHLTSLTTSKLSLWHFYQIKKKKKIYPNALLEVLLKSAQYLYSHPMKN